MLCEDDGVRSQTLPHLGPAWCTQAVGEPSLVSAPMLPPHRHIDEIVPAQTS
jgi:hypothetical protein